MNCPDKSIVLIGMMGVGKSAVGRCLQQRTGFTRFDTDEMVSSKFGIPISQIFSTRGEDTFREAETEVLRRISPDQPSIIVTGGGIVLREENVGLLKRLGVVVWLEARRRNALQTGFANWQSTIAARQKSEESVCRNVTSAPATLCKDCRYPCRYIALTDEEVAVAILTKLKGDCRNSTSHDQRRLPRDDRDSCKSN
jgi:shikimate kinase